MFRHEKSRDSGENKLKQNSGKQINNKKKPHSRLYSASIEVNEVRAGGREIYPKCIIYGNTFLY